ncbi:MAG TPA: biotin--[acetyl-CoA-carboxylase] ligase, partial [Chromatiaceae bacterium]|nr:biotin--[acetyl-CoA-carboxylase] ligase [Chromatiaceae bacterium]
KVQRAITNLRRKGFLIGSHPRRGYIFKPYDDVSEIMRFMYSAIIGGFYYMIIYYREVTSTRDAARKVAGERRLPSGYTIVTERMTDAYGRYGSKWYAPEGGLWFTMILKPKRFDVVSLIPIAATTAIVQAIRTVTGINAKIKWPNDIIYHDKKIGSVFTDIGIHYDRVYYVLLSINLNVNNEIPKEIRDIAISLKEIWGKAVPRVILFYSIIHHFSLLYYYMRYKYRKLVINEWKKYLETLGRRVEVIIPGEIFEGIAVDVKDNGALVVIDDEGNERIIFAGRITHLQN